MLQCESTCGLMTRTKPGRCPSGNQTWYQTGCLVSCYSDADCPDTEKCCTHDCGVTCQHALDLDTDPGTQLYKTSLCTIHKIICLKNPLFKNDWFISKIICAHIIVCKRGAYIPSSGKNEILPGKYKKSPETLVPPSNPLGDVYTTLGAKPNGELWNYSGWNLNL